MKKVFAVILHYGDKNITLRCLKSIIDTKNNFEEIVVIDNSKNFKFQNFTQSLIQHRMTKFKFKKLKIIRNERNLGYAGGVNIGIKYALSKGADYVLLLNNDIVFEDEIISELVKFLNEKKDAGIVAPAIKFLKNGKVIYDLGGKVNKIFGRTSHNEVSEDEMLKSPKGISTTRALPTSKGRHFMAARVQHDNIGDVDYVSGCSMLVKKEVFEKVGLLDEEYFLYYEDVDFCLKARKTGFKTYVLPTVSIFHNLSESVGKSSSTAIYNQTKSALIFAGKNLGINRFLNFGFILLQSFLFILKNPRTGLNSFSAIFSYYKNNFFLHISIFTFFGLLSYHKVLRFAFWKDDWFGIYQRNPFNAYLLHPGGIIEGFLFLNIFGSNVLLWQMSGIVFRILDAIAVSLMMQKLTRSKLTGFLSGLFFASTFGALDTVGWASAHISSIAILFMCTSIYFWIKFYEKSKNKDFLLYFVFLILAILSDPIRVVPIMILLVFLKKTVFNKNKDSKFAKIIQGTFYLFLILVSLFLFWYLNVTGNPIFPLISKIFHNPTFILNKMYLVGNYWGSLGNLILGWIINIPEDASTGIYNKLYARIAFVSIPLIFVLFILYLKNKSKKYAIILFFVLWIIIFYIPNWFSEPRLTMGGTHRFLNFSSVGFVALVAYIISLFKRKYLMVLFTLFFLILNIKTSNRILAQEEVYRSNKTVEHIWNTIDSETPLNTRDTIFIYRGEEPIRGNVLYLSGSIPLGIIRNIKNTYDLPIVTDDLNLIINLLCSNNVVRYQPGKMVYQKNRIPINHIYAWEVKNDGSIKNVSFIEKERIRTFAEKKCKVIEN